MHLFNRILLIGLLGISVASAEDLIYEPKVIQAELPESEQLHQRDWRAAFSFGQVIPTNLDAVAQYGLQTHYLISNRWYAIGELWYSDWEGQTDTDLEPVTLVTGGIGFDLLQGSAKIKKGKTLPWTMYAQLHVGDHMMADYSGTYVGYALGWRLMKDDYFLGLETRRFNVDDHRLQAIHAEEGYQWLMQLGLYF